jgi:hypothetical protein
MFYQPLESEMAQKTPDSPFAQEKMGVLPLLAIRKSYFGCHAFHEQDPVIP